MLYWKSEKRKAGKSIDDQKANDQALIHPVQNSCWMFLTVSTDISDETKMNPKAELMFIPSDGLNASQYQEVSRMIEWGKVLSAVILFPHQAGRRSDQVLSRFFRVWITVNKYYWPLFIADIDLYVALNFMIMTL